MQTNYVLDLTQAPVEREFYMNITKEFELQSDTKWLLKAKKNINDKHQAGRVWNKYLVEKITSSEVGFRKSKIYEWLLYQK